MSESPSKNQELIPDGLPEPIDSARKETTTEKLIGDTQDKQHFVETLRATVDAEAKSATETPIITATPPAQRPLNYGQHKEMKNAAYQRQLNEIRTHLSSTDRTFSKIIHSKSIDTISTLAANTVGRPTSLLLAGIFAMFGSLTVLLMSRHYGFSYNYSIFILMLGAGYIAGLLVDVTQRFIRKVRR